ncbi:X-ray radiation resistance-associated protein 1 [Phaethornis superciliosus]
METERRGREEEEEEAEEAAVKGSAPVRTATPGLCKMGDGNSYATYCFSARDILSPRKVSGSRHWVLAHRASSREPEKRTTGKTPQQRKKPPGSASRGENKENILDEPFLMKHHCLKNPSDLCWVNVSHQNLISAKEEDFEKFDCVAFVNAAENLLPLEPFRKFPGLRVLELSLNGLRNLKITAGDFLHLEDLDLSYNNLSPQDIWKLGDLPQLKVLHLTANELQSLPLDLAGSWDSAHSRFPSLEVLSLDDNHLSDPSVFVSLSQLCSLRELNLDRNGISAVPYLHQAESKQFFLHPVLEGDSFRAEWYKSLRRLWQEPQPPQQEEMELPGELEAKRGQLEHVMLENNRDPDRTEIALNSGSQDHPALGVPKEGDPSASKPLMGPSMLRDIHVPFPHLQHLSLAFNKLADEAALLPVAFFPCLKELTFHNNPLTTTRSGTPLLTQLLQYNLGIKLVRQQSLVRGRWHFSIPLKATRKVTSHLPKVAKRPPRVGAPAKTLLWEKLPAAKGPAPPNLAQLLPPSSFVTPGSSQWVALGEGEGDSRSSPGPAQEDVASFFMTQVEDVSRPLLRPLAENKLEQRSEQSKEKSSQVLPGRYKGYEELLGGDTDPDFIEPVGIQKNVQALYYTLKHPLVYRDTKPRLDSLQKPYVPWKRHGRIPIPPARKTRAEILEGLLMAMRNSSTITEAPLASVLQQKNSNPRAYREALRLMEEFQEVFDILAATLSKEMAKPLGEEQEIKTLPTEVTSKLKSSKMPGRRVAKKTPKI